MLEKCFQQLWLVTLKTLRITRIRALGLENSDFANLQYRSINCLFIETSLNAVILSQSYLLAPPERSTMYQEQQEKVKKPDTATNKRQGPSDLGIGKLVKNYMSENMFEK
ncbi:hypothetical protein N7489_003208 [Penicillium chrysogenum]|uniref:Uncharacterized protein n=1 Tax=Penicillium chrysogenum TaxID=5076 RepID=A0ABQ8W839_PENCH|nr:uncharacterized protein N7489_003208 [Penicillium chrysogenum]KAJ5252798.1 hypothetical protein N7489_003208 [Penicillium chrysogenum]KAJ5254050.1 hypothetical protein N7524_011230 [Penicillium chrysogenum]KAJ5260031.1 hypothetical protein N7505_009412 [Penicillium chrysogenum]KAJ6142052.1 hypothetical protein N7497_011151 [Penicillium chrysogenum]